MIEEMSSELQYLKNSMSAQSSVYKIKYFNSDGIIMLIIFMCFKDEDVKDNSLQCAIADVEKQVEFNIIQEITQLF